MRYCDEGGLAYVPAQFMLLYVMLYDNVAHEQAIEPVFPEGTPAAFAIAQIYKLRAHNPKFATALDIVLKAVYGGTITVADILATREYSRLN